MLCVASVCAWVCLCLLCVASLCAYRCMRAMFGVLFIGMHVCVALCLRACVHSACVVCVGGPVCIGVHLPDRWLFSFPSDPGNETHSSTRDWGNLSELKRLEFPNSRPRERIQTKD